MNINDKYRTKGRSITTFLMISIILIVLMMIQPFSDFTRGLAYGAIMLYAGAYFITRMLETRPIKSLTTTMALIFYGVSLLSFLVNGDIVTVGFAHFEFLFATLIALMPRSNEDIRKEVRTIAYLMVITGLLATGISLWCNHVYYTKGLIENYPAFLQKHIVAIGHGQISAGTRLDGLGLNANTTGNLLSISYIFSLYLLLAERRVLSYMLSIANIISSSIMIVIILNSRTSSMTIAIASAMFLFIALGIYKDEPKARKILLSMIALCILSALVILGIYITNPAFKTYVDDRILRVSTLETATGRTDIYRTSLELSKWHRIFGIRKHLMFDAFGYWHPHNIFLELIVSMGIPSLIIYCIYYFSIAGRMAMGLSGRSGYSKQDKKTVLLFLTFFVITVTQGMFENYMFGGFYILGFIMTYVIGTSAVLFENNRKEDKE